MKNILREAKKVVPVSTFLAESMINLGLIKDYEIIPFNPDEKINKDSIAKFMAKYVTKPFEYSDNVTGVELNFNKVFYKPENLRAVSEITSDIDLLEKELKKLEASISL